MFPYHDAYKDSLIAALVFQSRSGEDQSGTREILHDIGFPESEINELVAVSLLEKPSEEILSNENPAELATVTYLKHLDDCSCLVCRQQRMRYSDYINRIKK